jgi:Skp family chaperone for outer membrane proteins
MMKTSTILMSGVAALAALGCASAALAQAKPAPAKPAPAAASATNPPPLNLTATVAGVCILQRDAVLAGSTVGKYVQTRMGQLQNQVQAELSAEGTSLQTDAKSFDAKKTTLAQADAQRQQQGLQTRYQALQEKGAQRERELEATQQKALQRVWSEAVPLIGDVVKKQNCAVVLDGQAIMVANPAMDVTPGIVTALNSKITQFDFDREKLPAQQQ